MPAPIPSAQTGDRLRTFEALLHREVPLTQHMAVRADDYDGSSLTLSAALQPNINTHGTAFAGSMYSLAAVTGWGLLRLRLEDVELSPEVMLASAEIDYTRPVRGRVAARGACSEESFERFTRDYRKGDRTTVELEVSLYSGAPGPGARSAVFTGLYSTI